MERLSAKTSEHERKRKQIIIGITAAIINFNKFNFSNFDHK